MLRKRWEGAEVVGWCGGSGMVPERWDWGKIVGLRGMGIGNERW